MFKKIKEFFKTKNKQDLENLYELVYDVMVNKNNLIVDLEKTKRDNEFKIMELEEKVEKYKSKYLKLKEELDVKSSNVSRKN